MLVVVESDVSGELLDELRKIFTDKEIAVMVAGYKALIRLQKSSQNENYDRLSRPLQAEIARLEREKMQLIIS